ncbi:unnamed protein product [Lathyrus sativus]|nr:unnamed protein product [Lathyrus sativus]
MGSSDGCGSAKCWTNTANCKNLSSGKVEEAWPPRNQNGTGSLGILNDVDLQLVWFNSVHRLNQSESFQLHNLFVLAIDPRPKARPISSSS